MKTIDFPIPDCVPDEAVEKCIAQIKDLKEEQLTCTCDSNNMLFKDKDRVLHITYPAYFEDRDIFITGTLIGAVLYMKPWGIKKT